MPRFNDFDLDIQTIDSQLSPPTAKLVISTSGFDMPCHITHETCRECPYTYDLRCVI